MIWIGLTCVSLAALLFAEHKQMGWLTWVTKPLASLGFIGFALEQGALDSGYGQGVLVALVLSFIGDVLLIPRDSKGAFLVGLGSFLLGHVAFAVAFFVWGIDWSVWAIAQVCTVPLGILVWRWMSPHLPKDMKVPVVAYVLVICVMLAMSFGAYFSHSHLTMLIAAFLFWLSDLTVARQRFIAPGLNNRLIGLPLYYGAQLLFASGVSVL